jgi:hypothetical protein
VWRHQHRHRAAVSKGMSMRFEARRSVSIRWKGRANYSQGAGNNIERAVEDYYANPDKYKVCSPIPKLHHAELSLTNRLHRIPMSTMSLLGQTIPTGLRIMIIYLVRWTLERLCSTAVGTDFRAEKCS